MALYKEDNIVKILSLVNSDNSDDKYRYYACKENMEKIKCKQIIPPYSVNENNIVHIHKFIPECLDKAILKYKWMHKNTVIE